MTRRYLERVKGAYIEAGDTYIKSRLEEKAADSELIDILSVRLLLVMADSLAVTEVMK